MSNPVGVRWLGWLALAWCAAWCADLIDAWRHAPFDKLGVLAAAGWLAAFAVAVRQPAKLAGAWLALGGLASFVGVAGELNVAQHVALALVGAALVGGKGPGCVLLLLAVGWMPVLGWALRWAGPDATNSVRVLSGLAAAGCAWRWSRMR